MKSNISDRPMFKKGVDDSDVENVGIMQGFMDEMEAEDEMEDDEDYQTEKMLDRRPNSPEILMNNLRGDMRSIDARVEELADLVGYNAAADTPQDVLALLQPVLAQQQAAPMPPQGGIPAAMPPGAPAMPQGMPEMPPEAAMGGIGALPMDQGSGMEAPPVAMANGGYVQSFSDGSDEDGVTPSTETSSFAGVFPEDVVGMARNQVLSSLVQAPMAVPDLSTEVDKRIPLYEKLLGVDKNQSQAQILFELGQRAFNYGANVDDQGRPLTGSQASRLAGAVRTLPTAMGNISSQLEQQNRAVRSAALQSAEKDVQAIRTQNAKMVESQRKLWGDIAKANKGDKGFGTGLEGVAQTTLYKLAPEYAKGTLSDELTRKFESSLVIATQPIQYTDPYTGNIVTRTPELPGYVNEAVAARRRLSKLTPKVAPPAGEVVLSDLPEEEAIVGQVVGGAAPAASGKAKEKPKAGTLPGRTIWNSAEFIAGPVPAIAATVARVPGMGNVAPQVQQSRAYVTTAVNDLVGNLRTNDRFSETERKEIKNEIDIGPAFFDSAAALRNRMVGISEFLDKKIIDATAQTQDTSLPVDIRRDAADRVADMKKFMSTLGVPVRVYSIEQVQALPDNTPFLWNGVEPRIKRSKAQ